jgi:hypothetical protein
MEAPEGFRYIDIHTHLHPERLFRAIRKWFAERSDWKLEYPTEPELVAAFLRDHGVERFVYRTRTRRSGRPCGCGTCRRPPSARSSATTRRRSWA